MTNRKPTEEEIETGNFIKLPWEEQLPGIMEIMGKLPMMDQVKLVCFLAQKWPAITESLFFVQMADRLKDFGL